MKLWVLPPAAVKIRGTHFLKKVVPLAYFVLQSIRMNDRSTAEENLRVIRQLMERGTVYRAVAAPSALVAGILSLLVAAAVYYNNQVQPVLGRTVRPREFAILWFVVLILAAIANIYFLWREAVRDN